MEVENQGSVAVVAAPLIALSVIDLLVLVFGLERWLFGAQGRWIVMYGHFLFAPAAFWVVTLAARLGRRGVVVGLSSLAICYIVMTRFRGPWVWQGVLDYWQQSMRPWLWPVAIGTATGLLYIYFRGRVIKDEVPKLPNDLPYILTLGLCGVLDLVASLQWPFDSMFAPTLHLAIGGVAVVLTGFWFWLIRPEVPKDEKGFHFN